MSLNNLLDIKYFYWNEAYVVASQLFKNISFDLDESAAIENGLRTHEPFFFESFTNKKQYIENLEIFNFTNNELTKIKNLSTKLEEHIKITLIMILIQFLAMKFQILLKTILIG